MTPSAEQMSDTFDDPQDRRLANSRRTWLAGFEEIRRGHAALWAHAAGRRKGERVIFLAGDSIVLGYGRRGFSFEADRPESVLQRIDRLINLLAGDRGLHALYSGALGRADIAKMFRSHSRPGDLLLYQDWGWRPQSYDATYTNFASVASLAGEFGVEGVFLNSYARQSAQSSLRFDLPCSDRPGTSERRHSRGGNRLRLPSDRRSPTAGTLRCDLPGASRDRRDARRRDPPERAGQRAADGGLSWRVYSG